MTEGFLFDPIRKREVKATPEEQVRQALLHYFLDTLRVPPRLLAVEFDLRAIAKHHRESQHQKSRGRLDLVAFMPAQPPKPTQPKQGGVSEPLGLSAWAIAECKAPDIAIDESTARQLERYLAILPSQYLMATNGQQTVVLQVEGQSVRRIAGLPVYALG